MTYRTLIGDPVVNKSWVSHCLWCVGEPSILAFGAEKMPKTVKEMTRSATGVLNGHDGPQVRKQRVIWSMMRRLSMKKR